MSTDPYHVVQQEIQSSLQTAATLRASFLRIRSMARDREGSEGEELVWARNELKATLAALEADLEDLEESVKVVESTGPRLFNLDEAEVTKRRRYVGQVRREITNMRAEVEDTTAGARSPHPAAGGSQSPLSGAFSPHVDDPEVDHPWVREERQLMVAEQDRTMESISGTLTTLAQQAGLMGHEIGQHNEMLDDMERNVDRTDSKLSSAMRKMRTFIRETEDTKSGWCITILIIVLVILFVAVILV